MKYRDCTIYVVKTGSDQLCCNLRKPAADPSLFLAYAKSRFSHDSAYYMRQKVMMMARDYILSRFASNYHNDPTFSDKQV